MVRIRLVRVGRKHKPTYRIVVSDSRSANKGRFIDNIGHFNPRTDPESIVLKAERAVHWLSLGAQPSEAVARILWVENVANKDGTIKQNMTGEETAEAALAESLTKNVKAEEESAQ